MSPWRLTTSLVCLVASMCLAACGGCPEGRGGGAATSGGDTVAANPSGATSDVAPSQGPSAHETPEHNLDFDDHSVHASASDAPPERLTPDLVRHIIQGQLPDVHQCYEAALVRDATLSGRVVISMHISQTGNVVATEVAETTIADAAVGTCIAEHARHWHFPEAQHDIAVRYPFVLAPASAAPAGG